MSTVFSETKVEARNAIQGFVCFLQQGMVGDGLVVMLSARSMR